MGGFALERVVGRDMASELGQSTVEYAVVTVAFLAVVMGLGLLADLLRDGVLVRHAMAAASHAAGASFGGVIDVLCF